MTKLALVVLFYVFCVCECQDKSDCNNKETCSQCIQELGCVWCSELDSTSHCKHRNDITKNWCRADKIVDIESNLNIIENKILQSNLKPIVQITPQKVKLKLRKGEEFKLNFQYARASNYPIDLYYIMDLSASMKDHKAKLATLGNMLAATMKNITTDFRLGFGSFVDKTDMPFVSTSPNKINSPCAGCVKAYSFINHLPLTDNHYQFAQEVSKANVSGNLDAPEGGFDAIMQAIVCKEIGWRHEARHLIVFSTDAEYHVAGDGRLAGVVEPNDATCHMEDNMYTAALTYDYPSISHLNYVAKQNNINLVFAIATTNPRKYNTYEQLQHNIENSGVGKLDAQSSNVVDLVLDNYNKIADTVRMTDNSPSTIEVKYKASCNNATESGCTNIRVGQTINFTATIKIISCPVNHVTQTIRIKPEGVNEFLMVDVDVECECPCEKQGHPDYIPSAQAANCNNKGDSMCGVCFCHSGNFGRKCECDATSSTTDDDSLCKRNPNETEICSNLGNCVCGKCECISKPGKNIYGQYCECDDNSCQRFGNEICSGPDRGMCKCGICECLSGWTGSACECPNSNTTCIAPGGEGVHCSGHGECVCGECICNTDGIKYSGKYCEECPSCSGRCEELHPCVECQVHKTGKYNEQECEQQCTEFKTQIIDKIEENIEDESVKICRTLDKTGCTIIFQYSYDIAKNVKVEALKDKVCPEPIDLVAVILGVILSIVLGGLLLLIIWKVFTTIHDRREYARFENERKNAKWQTTGNPLYKGATTEHANPLFGRPISKS